MIDKTTKALLTVIAACLVILSIRAFQALPVQAGKGDIIEVRVVEIDLPIWTRPIPAYGMVMVYGKVDVKGSVRVVEW